MMLNRTVSLNLNGSVRSMATLKEISLRLKSVSNIAKITKSMKMIASTKMTKAQRLMDNARNYGEASAGFLKHVNVAESSKPVIVCVSSDRGLCGGIHSSVSKGAKKYLKTKSDAQLATIGLKVKNQMAREYRNNIAISYEGVAKVSPTWNESAMLADGILKNIEKADSVNVLYNKFKSVIAYELSSVVVSNAEALAAAPNIASYEVEEEVLKNYAEFALANTLYWAIAEGYASEMAARRTAMENATKNAGDMISKLTLTFNRQRQAVITNELCDIITGASAL